LFPRLKLLFKDNENENEIIPPKSSRPRQTAVHFGPRGFF
jgi:hypothetical protein